MCRLRRKITLFKQNKKKTDVTRLSTYAHDSRKRFQINPFFKILLNLAMGKEFSIWIGKSVCSLDGGMSFKVNYILLPPNYLAFRFEVFFFYFVFTNVTFTDILLLFFGIIFIRLCHWYKIFTVNLIHSALSFNLYCAIVFFIVWYYL